MKKNIISLVAVCLLGALFTVMAGEVKAIKTPYWQDIQTVSVNREEPRTARMIAVSLHLAGNMRIVNTINC